MKNMNQPSTASPKSWARKSRAQQGTALPVVLAMAVGVAALTTSYSMRAHREQQRANVNRYDTEALYEAMGQLEIVIHMINTSSYDEGGRNGAILAAQARADQQFIDLDGWPTGVTVEEQGPGILEIISEATVRGQTHRASAMVRERQSFADFNYFVDNGALGIAGGQSSVFPYADAPEGSIHSNDQIVFYFPDRHFRDAVTAAGGFDYTAGANGPDHEDGSNTWFHGAVNDQANEIAGLTDVDPAAFKTRTDNVLNLDGAWDYAKVWFMEDTVRVEHWQSTHYEEQLVDDWVEQFHYEDVPTQVTYYAWEWNEDPGVQQWEPVWENTPVWTYRWIEVETWVEGSGVDDVGGSGGSGSGGYIVTTWEKEWYWKDNWQIVEWNSSWEPGWVQVVDRVETEMVSTKITDGWVNVPVLKNVSVSNHKVATHDLPAAGTIYVENDVYIERAYQSTHGNDWNVLDGSLSIASGDDIFIRDSIVYAKRDPDGVLQTAYLNGNDKDQPYAPNPLYTGSSVLGLLAADRIEYQKYMPAQAEVNATMLARGAQVASDGIAIQSDGTAYPVESGKFVNLSLRRLGGIISNRRPMTSYVDDNNAVVRGFAYAKSVFDRRQLTNPPRGFPALNRPRVIAYLFREIK